MNPLQARLTARGILEHADFAILDRLHRRTSEYPPGCIVQHEKGRVETTRFIVSGWAMRYRTTREGDRQIVNFVLPGDSIGLYGALFARSISGVEMITEGMLAEFPYQELPDMFRQSARLGAALCWLGGQDERFLEQQILRIGALNATERIAHLLVELQQRILTAGSSPADAMTMPISQKLIAQALGISHVHANRCCRRLERQRLLETSADGLTLLEPRGLRQICGFDESVYRATDIPLRRSRKPE